MTNRADLVVIGAGVAGLSAAVFAARLGLNTLLLDRQALGGQVNNAGAIDAFPGLPQAVTGPDYIGRLSDQAMAFGVEMELCEALRLAPGPDGFEIQTDGPMFNARAVIVATGGTEKHLGVPGERELEGRGVSHCAVCDGGFFANKDVAVVGGGDEAFESAHYLGGLCRSVLLVHRRQEFRAAAILQKRLRALANVEILAGATVQAIKGVPEVERIVLEGTGGPSPMERPVAAVFICVGRSPNTGLLEGIAELSETGHAMVNLDMATSKPGLFAAGSARNASADQIVTVAADGVTAARSAHDWLKADRRPPH